MNDDIKRMQQLAGIETPEPKWDELEVEINSSGSEAILRGWNIDTEEEAEATAYLSFNTIGKHYSASETSPEEYPEVDDFEMDVEEGHPFDEETIDKFSELAYEKVSENIMEILQYNRY